MVSTRSALRQSAANVDESMGVRQLDLKPQLSPVASAKDIGRKPLRKFGRLKLDQIASDPNQPRSDFDEGEIERLASSIRKTGQLHPIRVRWDEAAQKWVIVTGERRYRATREAGLDAIDCYFHDDGITKSEILEQQLVENLLRQDLKPLEEARGYAALMDLNGWNGKQVADALRVSPSKVSRALALLELPEAVRARIESGDIGRSAAYELTKLDNQEAQRDLAERATAGMLTQRDTASVVRQRKGKRISRSSIRQTFVAQNGITVAVRANRKGTYHEIELALQEALEEVRLRIQNNIQLY